MTVFKSTSGFGFRAGDFFLGLDQRGQECGIRTDRHAITIAGSGSGKGAAVIIPNLQRWPHSVLTIDPKGENAEKTWKDRMDMGQSVHVIDPFQEASVPDQVRASFNPLEHIDKESLTAGSDLLVVADGLIKRSNPEHAEFDDAAMKILAGVMGYVLAEAPEDHRTIAAARNILMQTTDDLHQDAQRMMQVEDFDGIVRDAGNMILTALETEKSLDGQALSQAKRQTQWVGMKAFRNVLETSSFKLSDLKSGKVSVFLVLPPDYLETHGAFLKLFVRAALSAMQKGGANNEKKCLFILDEFFSLGYMDTILKGFGVLRGYGIQLWPFLQDIGQLVGTYKQEGAQTFFANSDVHQFFGTTDELTLMEVSRRLGNIGTDEVYLPQAPSAPMMTGVSMGRGISGLGGLSKNTYTRGGAAVMGGLLSAGESAITAARQAAYQDDSRLLPTSNATSDVQNRANAYAS